MRAACAHPKKTRNLREEGQTKRKESVLGSEFIRLSMTPNPRLNPVWARRDCQSKVSVVREGEAAPDRFFISRRNAPKMAARNPR